jgi:hypothetical protein
MVSIQGSIAAVSVSWLTISTGACAHQNLEPMQQHRATNQPHGNDLLLDDTQ